jgi:riboflavin transporter
MKNSTTRKIAFGALMIALGIYLKVILKVETGVWRIAIYEIPILLSSLYLGPIWGLATGIGVDLIYSYQSGFPFSLLMHISTAMWGAAGLFIRNRNHRFKFKLWIVVSIFMVLATAINTLQLYLWQVDIYADLFFRITIMIIKIPVVAYITYLVWNRVILPKMEEEENNE